jgi:2-octaprenyl-6-methoxyphenol hydroxylase
MKSISAMVILGQDEVRRIIRRPPSFEIMEDVALKLAIIGAGPVGLALALHAARTLPRCRISLFDARAIELDVARDPRTLALSLGSVQLLQRLGAWDAAAAQPIVEVHVSQQPPTWTGFGGLARDAELRIRAADEGVPMLGAVLGYGQIVAPLQAAWLAECAREPERLHTRFGTPVTALKPLAAAVEVDAGVVDEHDLAIVAEGGVFANQLRKPITHDYRQTAWVGHVALADGAGGVAYERFTRHGPAALLPLRSAGDAARAALVWCVASDDDPVRELSDAQRLAVLNTLFHRTTGRITALSPLKDFALGLNAERTLVDGRIVRIGNAAQTLHPVAGQGLNLGLRDSFELVHALGVETRARAEQRRGLDALLRRFEWRRAADRYSMIAATDFLARSFTWHLPGAGLARGLGIAALQALKPVRSALARQMMFGRR